MNTQKIVAVKILQHHKMCLQDILLTNNVLAALALLLCASTNSMYNNLVERCFDGCVSSFRSKTMDKSEISCLVRTSVGVAVAVELA
jgi:Tim10/DDP family zinc finger